MSFITLELVMAGGLWLLEVAANGLTDDRTEYTRPVTTAITSKSTEGLTCMSTCGVWQGRPCDSHSSFDTVHFLDIRWTFHVFPRHASVSARPRQNTIPITQHEQACCFSISITQRRKPMSQCSVNNTKLLLTHLWLT